MWRFKMFCGICFPCCWLLTPPFLPNLLSSCSTLSAHGICRPVFVTSNQSTQGGLVHLLSLSASTTWAPFISAWRRLHINSYILFRHRASIDSGILISILWFKTRKLNFLFKKGHNGISFSGKMPLPMCNLCMPFWWLNIENNQEGYATAINASPEGVRGRQMCEWSCHEMDLRISMC